MDDRFTYKDFDLLIERSLNGLYRARVLHPPAGESASEQFAMPFSPVELENFALKLTLHRNGVRGPGRPESIPLKDFGGRLFEAIFQGELLDTLRQSLRQTREQQSGLRLRLRLDDAPELAVLPWEFLYNPRLNRFLAQSRHTPLVRYLELPDPPHRLGVAGPLRLLIMTSSPSGYRRLDVEQEWDALQGALARHQESGRVSITRETANMSTLRTLMRKEEFHVFHFIGHGHYQPSWRDGVLIMEDRAGKPCEVPGEELGVLLNEHDSIRLAVLNACEGARSDMRDPFSGVAQSLIQQGLPAVVAMQFEISDSAAIIFARELYGAIADGYPLEAALADARGAIRDEGNLTEWGTPVLYSRASDGYLFDLATPSSRAAAGTRIPDFEESATPPRERGETSDNDDLAKPPVDTASVASSRKLVINLERVNQLPREKAGPLARYIASVQAQRGNWNGDVLAVRYEDLRSLAVIYDKSPTDLTEDLISWGVLSGDASAEKPRPDHAPPHPRIPAPVAPPSP